MNICLIRKCLIDIVEFRILKGADALQIEKPIKQELGGGYQIFLFDELEFYEGKINI